MSQQRDPIATAIERGQFVSSNRRNVPRERYARDVAGMPVYAAKVGIAIMLGPEAIADAVPGDDENCAIAQGCRTQLQTPYVSVGRLRTDLAMPHPKGVVKRGYGDTRWAVIRFENPPSARRVVIAADTGQLNGRGIVVELNPPRMSNRPGRPNHTRDRRPKGVNDGRGVAKGRGQDKLTLLGVRNLSGQRRKRVA